jgi:hypothetical protein
MHRILIVFNGGPHPDKDLEKFRAACLRRFPAASEIEIGHLYRRSVLSHDTPHKGRIVALFGQDIMTEDLEAHPLWPLFGLMNQNRLKSFPHDRGATIEGESISERAASRMTLLQHGMSGQVNRSVLVSPSGLKESYVFSKRTQWSQEVREDDWNLICQHPGIRKKFQVFEDVGGLVIYRAYSSFRPSERIAVNNTDDMKALIRDKTPKTLFKGGGVTE